MQLSIKDVSIISRTVRAKKTRTKREAYNLLVLCDARLKANSANLLTLGEGVRLTLAKVVDLIWQVRKMAKAQWEEARQAEAAQQALEAQREAGVA